MPDQGSNRPNNPRGSAHTGGNPSGQSTPIMLNVWANTLDLNERLYTTGVRTGKNAFDKADKLADWERNFNNAGLARTYN